MAERHSCPACGASFGSQREADDHSVKVHGGVAAKKGGEAKPEIERPPSPRPHGD